MDPATALAVGDISTKVLATISKYYSDVKDARTNIKRLVEQLEDFQKVVTRLGEKIQQDDAGLTTPITLEIHKSLDTSLECIKELQRKLDPGTGDRAMKRFGIRALKWPLLKAEVDEKIQMLEREKSIISIALEESVAFVVLISS